jgi:hypothetical protein
MLDAVTAQDYDDGLNRDGKPGEYDLRWVLLPSSFLKSGSLVALERQFELDR